MGRPVLIDKSFLKPKIIVDPIVIDTPSISFNYFKPEMDNQSISILVNLAFFTILTFWCFVDLSFVFGQIRY